MPVEQCLNPFPGLRPFETKEEYLFFGREDQSKEIVCRLRENRFLAVIGTSGSGKSSLVRAGLLPSLHKGYMAGRWRIAVLLPGNDPIGNLARALNQPGVLRREECGENKDEAAKEDILMEVTLRRSGLGVVDAVHLASVGEAENLLVVVDQFEELFRFADADSPLRRQEDAAAFVKLLLESTQGSTGDELRRANIYVVLTMRSEYIGDCAKFSGLPEAVTVGSYLIPWMTREQRRRAIEEPIGLALATISPRLVNRLLNDGGENPDQLPILQHALMRTWDYWVSHHEAEQPLDLEHYLAIGGVEHALSLHADQTYKELPDDHLRLVAKKLFQSLTEKGADNREIRRRTTIEKIAAAAGVTIQEVVTVVQHFRSPGRSFLMPPSNVVLDGNSLIDISHESLIRGWQRLKEWVEEEAESGRFYRRLAEWAAQYSKKNAALWQDPDLQNALDWYQRQQPNAAWAERYHPDFELATDFLEKSRQRAATEREAEERRREDEEHRKAEEEHRRVEELRRKTRQLRIVASVCLVAIIAMLVAVYYGWRYLEEKETASSSARSAKDNQNRTLQVTREGLVGLDRLPDELKNSTDVQNLYEMLLQEAARISAQVLQEDKANVEARRLAAISASMLSEVHMKQVRGDDAKAKSVFNECDQNVEKFEQLAKNGDKQMDLALSAMVLAYSADILRRQGADRKKTTDVALRAVFHAQEAFAAIAPEDQLTWTILALSYSRARSVLEHPERIAIVEPGANPLGDEIFEEARNEKSLLSVYGEKMGEQRPRARAHNQSEPQRASGSEPDSDPQFAILADVWRVAAVERALKMIETAIKTYESGIELAKRMGEGASSSNELIEQAFWLNASLAVADAESSRFDEAKKALAEAKKLQSRMPQGQTQSKFDGVALNSYFGFVFRGQAKAEKSRSELMQSYLTQAVEYDQRSLKENEEYKQSADPDQWLRLTMVLHGNLMRDYVLLRNDQGAEQEFQEQLALLVQIPTGYNAEHEQLARAYTAMILSYEEARDFNTAQKWTDREILALNARTKQSHVMNRASSVRVLLAQAYGMRSWLDLFLGDFDHAIEDAKKGFQLDPRELWILTNEAHGYLFAGKRDLAEQIYVENAQKEAHEGETFNEVVLNDFKRFRENPNPRMNLQEVASMQAELDRSLTSSAPTPR